MWEIINQELGKNNSVKKDTVLSADDFSNYFSQVIQNLLDSIPRLDARKKFSVPKNDKTMFIKPLTEQEVLNKLYQYSTKNTFDIDYVPSVFKTIAPTIAPILTHIFNI